MKNKLLIFIIGVIILFALVVSYKPLIQKNSTSKPSQTELNKSVTVSQKIILSHSSKELKPEQKEIGSSAYFGMLDLLIPANQDYLRQHAFDQGGARAALPRSHRHGRW